MTMRVAIKAHDLVRVVINLKDNAAAGIVGGVAFASAEGAIKKIRKQFPSSEAGKIKKVRRSKKARKIEGGVGQLTHESCRLHRHCGHATSGRFRRRLVRRTAAASERYTEPRSAAPDRRRCKVH